MKICLQLAILFGVCLAGEGLSVLLPFPFPASVAAMLLLLLLFVLRVLRVPAVEETADFFLRTMALLFVPATVAILKSLETVRDILFPLLIICVLCTVFTFLAAAGAATLVIRLQERFASKGGVRHD